MDFLGLGLLGGGYFIGDGIKDAGVNLHKASEEVSKGMLNSSEVLAKAGLEATDLATKRVCLAFLEATAKVSAQSEVLMVMFNENNRKIVDNFSASLKDTAASTTQSFDFISKKRTDEVRGIVESFSNNISLESNQWRNASRQVI